MNFKALATTALIAATSLVAAPKAEAFWGPSKQDVCEANYSHVQNLRNGIFSNLGLGTPNWTGSVASANKNANAPALGYKVITGCVTQYTYDGTTYIQGYNVEKTGDQYYISLAPHIQLG